MLKEFLDQVKKKVILIFIASLAFSACSTDSLKRACPGKCLPLEVYEYSEKRQKSLHSQMGIGECHYGKPVCDDENNLIDCKDYQLPEVERCDNKDNNCNGSIDEVVNTSLNDKLSNNFNNYGEENPCINRGECRYALAYCDKKWKCDYSYNENIELGEEISCDGLDNDCDGRIDEDLFQGEFCFSAPDEDWWKASNDPCRPGTLQCVNGNSQCVNEITPSPEVCDQIDNDCNGVVDDSDNFLTTDYDILFLVDTSGTMCDEINAVVAALDAYSSQFENNDNFQFALVDIASNQSSDYMYVKSNFVNFVNIRNSIQQLSCQGSGLEPQLDALKLSCDGSFQLNWRQDSEKFIFLLTDETCQSYMQLVTSVSDAYNACNDIGARIFSWFNVDSACFEELSSETGGMSFSISDDWEKIFNDMNDIVIEMCQ